MITLLRTEEGRDQRGGREGYQGLKTARDERAGIRDKVRKLHNVRKEQDTTRGGVVFHIK